MILQKKLMQYQEIVDKIPLISIANKKHKYYQIINLYNPSKNMRDKMEKYRKNKV